jgi:two-component system sensor histidine kinase BaeS
MLDTLRRRLILSHVLPLLLIIPLIGMALIYALETRILLPDLSQELARDAVLVADLLGDRPGIWQDPTQAQAILARTTARSATRMMLLDANGRLLASSDPADAERLGQRPELPILNRVLSGEFSVDTTYSQQLQVEVVDVWTPVVGANQQIIGVLRLSHPLISIRGWLTSLRYFIMAVLAVGLLLGTAVGLVLVVGLEQPLRYITRAVYQVASDQRLTPLPEEGPEELRLLARAVNILAARRREVEKASRQLLANLVHELGRPLGAFHSALQALQKGAVEDEELREELLAGMAAEVGRLQRLLEDMGHLHQRVVGKLDLDRQPTPLNEWLSRLLSPWREAAKAKKLQWEVAVAADLPTLEVDPDRLGQALGNLLSNAIKYTPSGGTVSVSGGTTEDMVWVRVSDTGRGIALEDQERIFTPFYRVHRPGDPDQGTGLGLSIARDLVVAHDGRLEVESAPGQGSHFILWLPVTTTGHGRSNEQESNITDLEPAGFNRLERKHDEAWTYSRDAPSRISQAVAIPPHSTIPASSIARYTFSAENGGDPGRTPMAS